ncbi:MAG: UvrD-helicase domain-containing protein [Candidatus Cloacimonetes bacterium]|nr:UvrD-helicase domain-containing protein [Candidatus Cloacimonadota bacterium]
MLLEHLDPQQQKVVLNTEGPLLVFAGAGSGKTRSIIYRAAYLIQEMGTEPWKILIVTFTNKAARELKERLAQQLFIDVRSLWVGTFHSICATILRFEAKEHQLPFTSNFTIFDADDQKGLLKKIYKELDIDASSMPIGTVASIISRTKSSLINTENFFDYHPPNVYTESVYKIFIRYQQKLRDNNALDFDDLLMETAILLANNEIVLHKYRRKFSHIMIDEYQDTNFAQFRIIQLLGGEHGNICAVGDDDQAIYSWRGASIQNIINFAQDFNNATIIRLEQNYRSSQPILDIANKLISCNSTRHPKQLWSDRKKGERPVLHTYETDTDEAKAILQDINHLFESQDFFETVAILYRTNAQSRIFETVCLELGIPYKVHGSLNFFQRKEIKDIIAYLRVIINPEDTESLLRIINFPPRTIGGITIGKLAEYSAERGITLYQGLIEAEKITTLSNRQQNSLSSLVSLLLRWQNMISTTEVTELLEDIYQSLQIIEYYSVSKDFKDVTRIENIKEFLVATMDFAENYRKENDQPATLVDFLQNISLFTTLESEYENLPEDGEEKQQVNLMTLHNAKGLEFDYVFISGLEEKLLPHQLSLHSNEEIEEERRLLYVGITRAKSHLFLSYARYRRTYYGYEITMPSRFIKEIFPEQKKQIPIDQRNYNKSVRVNDFTEKKVKIPWIKEDEKLFRIGQRVRHKDFGDGTVLSVEGKGKDAKLSILFRDGKLKKIIGSYVQILTEK